MTSQPSEADGQQINSQESETSTATLSNPSQTIEVNSQELASDFKMFAEKECQTRDGIYLSNENTSSIFKSFYEQCVVLIQHKIRLRESYQARDQNSSIP